MRQFLVSCRKRFGIPSMAIALAIVMAVSGFILPTPAVYAQTAPTLALSSVPATYDMAGSNVTVNVKITYTGEMDALGGQFVLPPGWTATAPAGEDKPALNLKDGKWDFYWTTPPASPVDFSFTATVPAGNTGNKQITGSLIYAVKGSDLGPQTTAAQTITLTSTGVAPAATLTMTHTAGTYIAGGTVVVTGQIKYSGELTALGLVADVPAGWTYAAMGGLNPPDGFAQNANGDDVEFYWHTIPDAVVNFTYTLKVPAGTAGDQNISAKVLYRRAEGELEAEATPKLLVVKSGSPVEQVSVTHSSGSYFAGSNLTVSTCIEYGGGELSALGLVVTLPEGWGYVSFGGNTPPNGAKAVGATVEFYWTDTPASPVDFTYTVTVPAASVGTKQITAEAKYRRLGEEVTQMALPDPLSIVQAAGETLSMKHSCGNYVAGSQLTVSNQISYTGSLSAVGVKVMLPEGWTYVSAGGVDEPDVEHSNVRTDGDLEFSWVGVPASTIDFTYTVNVPVGTTGQQQITAEVIYRRLGDQQKADATPNPLLVNGSATATLNVTHSSVQGDYTPGNELTISNQITYTGTLTAIGAAVDLPEGCTYVSIGGADAPQVQVLANGDLEVYWVDVPASAIDFTYTMKVPAGTTGVLNIGTTVKYRRLGDQETQMAQPNPLTIGSVLDFNTISATAGNNGSISPAGIIGVAKGANQTFTMTPNTGYAVEDVLVDNVSVGAVDTYTFTNVLFNRTIHVTFKRGWLTTSVAPADGGKIVVRDMTAMMVSADGFALKDVIVNGVSKGPLSSYTFSADDPCITGKAARNARACVDEWWPHACDVEDDPEEPTAGNCTIHAVFEATKTTLVTGANGLATLLLNADGTESVAIMPDPGFEVADILIDGVSVGAASSYKVPNDGKAHKVEVLFKKALTEQYTVTVTTAGNGWVNPGTSIVKAGEDKTFAIIPGAGAQILNVLVDGKSVGAVGEYSFKNVTAAHTLHAVFSDVVQVTYIVKATAGEHGTISPSGENIVAQGQSITFNMTPEAGYLVSNVIVDGVAKGALKSYTFDAVSANHEISVSFTYVGTLITATWGADGMIVLRGMTAYMIPNAGYEVENVAVNGASVGTVSDYTFTLEQCLADASVDDWWPGATGSDGCTIHATYKKSLVTATAGTNGFASVVTNADGAQVAAAYPERGYVVDTVTVDGVLLETPVTAYTFSDGLPHTIHFTFKAKGLWHTVTATHGANGTIDPSGEVDVDDGQNQTFAIKAAVGYVVADLVIDGNSIGAAEAYTFENVVADHTIHATFAPVPSYIITASAGENGKINPDGEVKVYKGMSQTFTMEPDEGYTVADVTVDGESVSDAKTYTFNDISADHTVHVTFKKQVFYTITATAGENGSISPAGEVKVEEGSDKSFAIVADAGYVIADVTVDGESVDVTDGTYTFTNVTEDHTIAVTFEEGPLGFVITATAGENGAINPAGEISVVEGENRTFTMLPNDGYAVKDVHVDGVSVGKVTTYTFTDVMADHTIHVVFEVFAPTYNITAAAGANGTITPSGTVAVNKGANQTFYMQPASGYMVENVTIDGAAIGSTTTYTFMNVVANHNISVTFKLIPVPVYYTITASAGANGSITPSGALQVVSGSSQTFTITAAKGYSVGDVAVDGKSVGAVTSYTFVAVSANHSITATFVPGEKPKHTIKATAGENGTITPSGDVNVSEGDNQSFTMTAATGYKVADVKVDDKSVGAVTTYTFTNVVAAHVISVTFAELPKYTVKATAGANGTITPSGDVTVYEGASRTFTMNPSYGYEVEAVKVDGQSVGTVTTYTFQNVTANHEISVTFKETVVPQYTITVTVGANGTITPTGDAGKVLVKQGASQTFTITPYSDADMFYEVEAVTVDGEPKGAVKSYAFSNVTGNHTIHVTFAGPFVKYKEGTTDEVKIGIKIGVNVKSLKGFKKFDPAGASDTGKPKDLPMGLIAFVIELADAKVTTATVDVTFTKAAAADAKWFFYNESTKSWSEYTAAKFSGDRKSVTLTLTDGGAGDTDKVTGTITDPSGYGVPKAVVTESHDPGDDNCFISSTVAGSPNAHTHFGLTSALVMLMTLLGGAVVFFVRKVRARRSGK